MQMVLAKLWQSKLGSFAKQNTDDAVSAILQIPNPARQYKHSIAEVNFDALPELCSHGAQQSPLN